MKKEKHNETKQLRREHEVQRDASAASQYAEVAVEFGRVRGKAETPKAPKLACSETSRDAFHQRNILIYIGFCSPLLVLCPDRDVYSKEEKVQQKNGKRLTIFTKGLFPLSRGRVHAATQKGKEK